MASDGMQNVLDQIASDNERSNENVAKDLRLLSADLEQSRCRHGPGTDEHEYSQSRAIRTIALGVARLLDVGK